MKACGIEMAASEARLVLLDGNKSDFHHINVGLRKLKISDDEMPMRFEHSEIPYTPSSGKTKLR